MKELKVVRRTGLWHLLAGIIMLILGVYVWFHPAVTLLALALYLGIVFIAVGLGYFMASFSYDSGWYMMVGVLDILVGVVFVGNIGVTALSLPIIFALWSMAIGAIQLVTAFQFKRNDIPWSWSLCSGILGILFGFLILLYPSIGTITITALMGTYIILFGVIGIAEYYYNRKIETA